MQSQHQPQSRKPEREPQREPQLTEEQLRQLAKNKDKLPPEVRERVSMLLSQRATMQSQELARTSFLHFARAVWPPEYVFGQHHKTIADAFERVNRGSLKRLIIALAPRHSKSEMSSFLLPAWFIGNHPHRKVIQASNTQELATSFGRKVRNLVSSPEYQAIFPNVSLSTDSTAAGRWDTNRGGSYFAIGVGGTMTGRGADLLIIDDPHTENDAALAAGNPAIYDKTFEWYTSGPRQRLQPKGAIVLLATRWSKRDLTGQILKSAANNPNGDHWEVIEFPALDPYDNPVWPEFWTKEALLAIKASLPLSKWLAQYQQNPTAEKGALIKREWWMPWEPTRPPKCEYKIQAWDTAHTKTDRSDYSACTTWGVFYKDENPDDAHIILLDAYRQRLEFHELKKQALEMWEEWEPDALIVENKASGIPLITELRRAGLPIQTFTPSRGNDKITRVNAVSDLFSSGKIWYPQGRKWAEEVIEETASFPSGEHDDLVDSLTCALLRFRRGGFIRLPSDYEEDNKALRGFKSPRARGYYTV